MTKDDSYHKKRGKGFIFSPERQIYKTDELRYALEDLQKLHEDVMFIRDEEKTPTEKLEFLDSEGEWFYYHDSSKVYFWPKDNINPNTLNIRAKVKSYALRTYKK